MSKNKKRSGKNPFLINPRARKAALSFLNLPYTVFQPESFKMDDYIKDIEYETDNEQTDIPSFRQEEMWESCLDTSEGGWTGIFTSVSDVTRPEALALTIAAEYAGAGRNVAWHNCTVARWYKDSQIKEIANPRPLAETDLLVVTGLRWDGDPIRLDKTFDLIRAAPVKATKIIVGVGTDPITLSRKLGIPAQRVVYLRNYTEINM